MCFCQQHYQPFMCTVLIVYCLCSVASKLGQQDLLCPPGRLMNHDNRVMRGSLRSSRSWTRVDLVQAVLLGPLLTRCMIYATLHNGDFIAPPTEDIFLSATRVKTVCDAWAQQGQSNLLMSLATGYQLRQVGFWKHEWHCSCQHMSN